MSSFLTRRQLIYTYGVGAVVPLANKTSMIVSGLDDWESSSGKLSIEDKRLEKFLGIGELRMPPSCDDIPNWAKPKEYVSGYTFPTWYFCPKCGQMKRFSPTDDTQDVPCPNPTCSTSIKGKKGRSTTLLPERLCVVCPSGHLDDFPFVEFVKSAGCNCAKPKLIRTVNSNEVGAKAIAYKCGLCGKAKNLGGYVTKGAFDNKTIHLDCSGNQPWLNRIDPFGCSTPASEIRVLPVNGTNVWYSKTVSSIYLPESDGADAFAQIFKDHPELIPMLDAVYNTGFGVDEDGARGVLDSLDYLEGVDKDALFDAYKIKALSGGDEKTEDEYLQHEYELLKEDYDHPESELYVKKIPMVDYDETMQPYFESVSKVYKLTETKAFIGFSRVMPKNDQEITQSISKTTLQWLPAVQDAGEGIMIVFNKQLIEKWKQSILLSERTGILTNRKKALVDNWFASRFPDDVSPEFLLIHTFAHLLINELGRECGYGPASLRERIYCDMGAKTDMRGCLIYTSSGSSEGALGGLVSQATPGKLERIIRNALERARWCTSDPLCIHSMGQGPDSLNLAACHNCGVLPETCCCFSNRILDRGAVVGTIDNSEVGFFSSVFGGIAE